VCAQYAEGHPQALVVTERYSVRRAASQFLWSYTKASWSLYHCALAGKHWWLYQGAVYSNNCDLSWHSGDIKALLDASANRQQIQLQKAYALQAETLRLKGGS
jgi:hypothetical protein